MRNGPFGMANFYVGVFEGAIRVEGRDAEVQFVVGGHGLNVAHLVSKEDAEMRAPGNEIPCAADAAAQGAVSEIRRDRDRSFIFVDYVGALVFSPIASRDICNKVRRPGPM